MKKKLLALFLAVCAAMCLCFGLAACSPGGTSDGGDLSDGTSDKAGLYDANNNLLATYEESGMDVTIDYPYYDYYKTAETSAYYVIQNKYPTTVKVVLPDTVAKIGFFAFCGCTSLTSITIPDSVTSIGRTAFSYCSRLTSITIPDSVTSIGGYAFSDCSRLTSITIPDSVTSIGGYAFYHCTSLTSVIFKNTSGWSANPSNRFSISSDDLADPATAAKYLTDTYFYYDWTRS